MGEPGVQPGCWTEARASISRTKTPDPRVNAGRHTRHGHGDDADRLKTELVDVGAEKYLLAG